MDTSTRVVKWALHFTSKFAVVTVAMLLLIMNGTQLLGQMVGYSSAEFELSRRIKVLEEIKPEARLAVLERLIEEMSKKMDKSYLDYLSQGGIGVLLLKAMLEARKKGKNNEDET